MAVDADLIKARLGELAAEAEPLRATRRGIAGRIRRRRRMRAAWTAAACAVLMVVAAALARPGDTTPAPIVGGTLPPGDKAVGYHGVEVLVPSSWTTKPTRCGAALGDPVVEAEAGEMCLAVAHTAVDVVWLGPYQEFGRGGTLRPPGRPMTVFGRAATLSETRLPDGRTSVSLAVPDLDVRVTAETGDAAYARRLVASLRPARPADSLGCVDPVGDLRPLPSGRAPAALVPAGFTTMVACVYDEKRMSLSVTLGRGDALRLATRLNALRPGLQSWKGVGEPASVQDWTPCTPYFDPAGSNGYLLRFSYPTGGPVEVVVREEGCTALGATNGVRTGRLNPALLTELRDLFGTRRTPTPLDELIPR